MRPVSGAFDGLSEIIWEGPLKEIDSAWVLGLAIAIPLAIVGNLMTEVVKRFWRRRTRSARLKDLERRVKIVADADENGWTVSEVGVYELIDGVSYVVFAIFLVPLALLVVSAVKPSSTIGILVLLFVALAAVISVLVAITILSRAQSRMGDLKFLHVRKKQLERLKTEDNFPVIHSDQ